ncbi:MAG TPA: class I SAM-dependent methyltransferase [Chloroflexota bacterium]|nr:class I SAM-dependent methyltransferase [Chloroflexota bacterium]
MLTLVSDEIEAYASQHTTPLPPLLEELQATTHEKTGRWAQMMSGQVEGMLLQMLALAVGAKRILEFGTFTGFSAQMMAAALPDDGELITLDVNPDTNALAQSFWDRSPHGHKIHPRLGPALETVKTLQGVFDLIFIDADKEAYTAYYEAALPLLTPNGFMVVDNVLRSGRVLQPDNSGDRAVAALNEHVQADDRVINVMLAIRDGVTLVRHKR